jgi:hypothetical protein
VFSEQELILKTSKFANEIIKLTPEEKNELDSILIEMKTPGINLAALSMKYLIDEGKNKTFLGIEKIFKFSENNPDFKKLCQMLSLPHMNNWAAILREKQYPHFTLPPLDKTKPIKVSDLYFSAFFLSQSNKASSPAAKIYWLNRACEYGLFQAQVARTNRTIGNIKDAAYTMRAREKAISDLISDMRSTCNIYGAAGYFHSALLLKELGSFYSASDDSENRDSEKLCNESAAEHFFCGKILYEEFDEKNVRLFDILTKKQGLAAFGFDKIETGQSEFLASVDDDIKILNQAIKVLKALRNPPAVKSQSNP